MPIPGLRGRSKRSLEERIRRAGMEEKFETVLVPTEEVVEVRGGQQRKSERKFYPGYVLVKMEMTDETWHLVKDVPKVMGFIGGTGDKPAPVPESQANAILQRMQEGTEKPRPKGPVRAGRGRARYRWPVYGLQRGRGRGRL